MSFTIYWWPFRTKSWSHHCFVLLQCHYYFFNYSYLMPRKIGILKLFCVNKERKGWLSNTLTTTLLCIISHAFWCALSISLTSARDSHLITQPSMTMKCTTCCICSDLYVIRW
jgi:hypothetical protein